MQEGVVTTMASPGPVDRLAALRSMVTREGLIVENADLQHLAEGHPTWRSLENALRAHLHASDRVAEPSPAVTDHVQTATTVIERALDAVDAGGVIGGIELMAPVPELSDAWSPEVPKPRNCWLALLAPRAGSRRVGSGPRSTGGPIAAAERARSYLVRDVEQLEASDAVRAADALAEIDLGAETAIARRRHHAEDQSLRLEALKARWRPWLTRPERPMSKPCWPSRMSSKPSTRNWSESRRTLAAPRVWPCCVLSVSRRRGRDANAVVERRRQFRLPT